MTTNSILSDSTEVEKLYKYGEQLSEAKDKSKNVKDYEGIISAARGSVKAKQLAAQLIPKYFKWFPSLAPQAVEAHFDLCEEEELAIRVQAIRGLPLLCKDTPDYVPKIVDVLGQLLTTEENVERDAVNKALMSLLRQDTKASLTALFKHIEGAAESSADDSLRVKVISFLRDKVFPLKSELLKPKEEMERHITDLVKKILHDVNGIEFKMFMDFLKNLSLFGESAPPESVQELAEIIEEQADLNEQFNASDDNHIARVILCMYLVIPFLKRGASNSKFHGYLNKNILPVIDKFPEERRLELLKNLAESSPYAAPQDSRQLLPAIVTLLKKYMPRRKAVEELNFTCVECLLYTFHHLAYKTPNATNSLCGYKIVTGQPSDRLGEDFSDNYEDLCARLTTVEDLTRATNKKLNQGLPELEKALSTAKTDEDKANIRIKKQNTITGVRTCNNILAMTQHLHSKSPLFIGDDKITPSWKPVSKPPTAVAAGKRAATAANIPSNAANKRGRSEGGVQNHLIKQTLKSVYHGGQGGTSGRRQNVRGRGGDSVTGQFASRVLNGLFHGGGGGGRGRLQGGRGRGRGYQ